MDDRGSWKVGLIAILAIFGVIAMLAFLLPGVHAALTGGRWHFNILFDDVGGLQQAENVTLAGVNVGNVDSVTLVTDPNSPEARAANSFLATHGLRPHQPPYAVVKLSMRKESRGTLFSYYSYQVGSSSLIGTTHQVTITPAPPPAAPADKFVVRDGDYLVGTSASSLSDLAKPAAAMMGSVADLTRKIQGLVGDPRLKQQLIASLDEVHAAADNLRLMTGQARDLTSTANATLSRDLPKVGNAMDNVQATTANFRVASNRIPGMMSQAQGSLSRIQGNFVTASRNANVAVQNIDDATGSLKEFLAGGSLNDLHDTVANFKAGSANLAQMTQNMQKITADPRTQELPQIIANLKTASDELPGTVKQAKDTLGSFQQLSQSATGAISSIRGAIPGGKSGSGEKSKPGPARQRLNIESGIGMLYSNGVDRNFPHKFIVDPGLSISTGQTTYLLGLYDIGGENRLTAEASSHLLDLGGGGANLRYGLYRGRAAVGADFLLGDRLGIYSTLYDPNNPTVDVEGLFDVGRSYALWAGFDELNRHARPVVGIRLKP